MYYVIQMMFINIAIGIKLICGASSGSEKIPNLLHVYRYCIHVLWLGNSVERGEIPDFGKGETWKFLK
jgi:hypothetical protein